MAESDHLTPLPWQRTQWVRLHDARDQGRLAHAVLLQGVAGLGVDRFAQCFAQSLLCRTPRPDRTACGLCAACRQFAQGVSADYRALTILKDKTQITVDQVRELIEFLSLTRGSASSKVAVIEPAEAMNINASNSLLKTLEEPPGAVVLMLVAANSGRLPATIRSRCQLIKFPQPDPAEAHAWLAGHGVAEPELALRLAHGAPCRALEQDNSAERQAFREALDAAVGALKRRPGLGEFGKCSSNIGLPRLVQLQMSLLRDLLRCQVGASDASFENPVVIGELRTLCRTLNYVELSSAYDRCVTMLGMLNHPLSPDLSRDRVLVDWIDLVARH